MSLEVLALRTNESRQELLSVPFVYARVVLDDMQDIVEALQSAMIRCPRR